MTLLISSLITLTTLIFIYSKMPLIMSISVILQVIMTASILSLVNKSSWYSYILAMIYLSAMMIIFIYVSSLSSNLRMFNNPLYTYLTFSALMLSMLTPLIMNLNPFITLPMQMKKTMTNLYSHPSLFISILAMTYLLLTLIIVVKNITSVKGPMKT